MTCASDLLLEYDYGALLPDAAVEWWGPDERLVDLVGYSFRLQIARRGSQAALVDKTAGFLANDGTSGPTNLTVGWAHGEIDILPPGAYAGRIVATRTADSAPRILMFTLRIRPLFGG